MSEEKLSRKEEVLEWVGHLDTPQTLTDELRDSIYEEVEDIPDITEALLLLKDVSHVLNMIPNNKNVGRDGESSYDMASRVDRFLKLYNS